MAIFFSGLLFYLVNFVLLPYKSDDMLDVKNLAIVSAIFVLAVTSIFAFFHLIIDKLFFRRFYEKPRIDLAVRRGGLLGIVLAGLAWLRVFGFWELHIILLVLVLVLLFEAFFLSVGSGSRSSGGVKKESREEEK